MATNGFGGSKEDAYETGVNNLLMQFARDRMDTSLHFESEHYFDIHYNHFLLGFRSRYF